MPRIEELVATVNRTWREAAPSIAQLQELTKRGIAGVDREILERYDTFRFAVAELLQALKALDLAIAQWTETEDGDPG